MARIIRPTTRPCIPRFVGIRGWKGLSMGRVRMKKKRLYRQMRARSSDYVGCRVKSKVSPWFFFFIATDADGFDSWGWTIWRKGWRLAWTSREMKVERGRTCNVYCICLLLLIGLTIFLSFLISISVKIRTCNFLHSSSCTWHESLNTIDPLDLYLTGFRDNV